MKRFYTYLIIFLLPAYSHMSADRCTTPDMQQSVFLLTATSDEPTVDGEYSLSPVKTVRFAKGNLLHQPSTGKWRIAPRAYDMVGGKSSEAPVGTHGTIFETINGKRTRCSNDKNHKSTYAGWIDLFPWGTSGWYGQFSDAREDSTATIADRNDNNPNQKVTINPYEIDNTANYILGGNWRQGLTDGYKNADWGIFNNVMLGGDENNVFRTPTREEAVYLLSGRPNARSLRGNACIRLKGRNALGALDPSVEDTIINGHIIMPNGWDWADAGLEGLTGRDFKSAQVAQDGTYVYFADNEFSEAEWIFMEAKGAIFLPACGGMSGASSIKANRSGFYWSATPSGSNKCYDLQFGGMTSAYLPMEQKSTDRYYCRAVRLCQESVAKSGGAKSYTPESYVAKTLNNVGGTITAVRNETDHYKWTLTATPAAGYQLAYWIDLYGGKSHENPMEIAINLTQPSIVWRAVFVRSNVYIHEWTRDSLFFRSDTSNIFSYAGAGRAGICIEGEHELASPEDLDSVAPGIWTRATSAGKDNNKFAGKHMHFVMYDNCARPTAVVDTIVPVMIYGDSLSSAVNFHVDTPHTSVQVFDGATLTINANTEFSGFLDIHAGGKVIVQSGYTLTVEGIIMRGNGVTKKWPQLIVNGNIQNNNNDTIYYDYTLDQHAYYPLALPYDAVCAKVRNPINRKKTGYMSYAYNTTTRSGGVSGWAEFIDGAVGARFEASKGYIIYAAPAKWKGTRQKQAILRFPMVHDFSSANEVQKSISIVKAAAANDIDKNWNLIGNPYLANVTLNATNDETMLSGYAKWNDSSNEYELVPDEEDPDVRYITYSNNGFRTYIQSRLKGFTMLPFNCYFVQADDEASSITIALADRAASAPLRMYADGSKTKNIETGITLTQGDNSDQIGLLFGDFTDNYELNADLAKEFGEEQPMSAYSLMGSTPLAFQALPIDAMARPIPLGYRKAGSGPMTFSFDDSQYNSSLVDGLWLTDVVTGQVTNLLVEDYTFTPESAQDDSRFYLSCERRKVVDVTTDVEEIEQQRTIIRVFDMFGREMRGDVNSLPQGVYVLMDNLGNTKKEILGQ